MLNALPRRVTLSLVDPLSLAVFLSGASALVAQTVWLRHFSLLFGGTTRAASLVLAVFMGGLALGSWACTRRRFRQPLKAYARVEAGIGLSILATLVLLPFLPSWYGSLL